MPDYWLLQGVFLLSSAAVIVANLLTNLAFGWLDRGSGPDHHRRLHRPIHRPGRLAVHGSWPRAGGGRAGPAVGAVSRRPRPGLVGLVVLALLVLTALFAPLSPQASASRSPRATGGVLGPRRRYPRGPTTTAARCLTLLIWGARISLFVGLTAT